MYSIKPIDKELILRCASETGANRHRRGTQHFRRACGGDVSEALAWGRSRRPHRVCRHSGHFYRECSYKELLAKYGVDANGVAQE